MSETQVSRWVDACLFSDVVFYAFALKESGKVVKLAKVFIVHFFTLVLYLYLCSVVTLGFNLVSVKFKTNKF